MIDITNQTMSSPNTNFLSMTGYMMRVYYGRSIIFCIFHHARGHPALQPDFLSINIMAPTGLANIIIIALYKNSGRTGDNNVSITAAGIPTNTR